MEIPDRERLLRRASILKSLAHPSRLLMIEMLEKAPRCVGELTEAVGSDITTVSKHLAVLKRVGLVRDVREGQFSRYSIVCDCVSHLVDCIEKGMRDHGSPDEIRPPGAGVRCSAGRSKRS
ncbi:MAG: winged helix-turn-helix transcriptional regulator [Treponema sp.]|nr:winged helix-turn-helix transcriptional regulator [Treponema sp.]